MSVGLVRPMQATFQMMRTRLSAQGHLTALTRPGRWLPTTTSVLPRKGGGRLLIVRTSLAPARRSVPREKRSCLQVQNNAACVCFFSSCFFPDFCLHVGRLLRFLWLIWRVVRTKQTAFFRAYHVSILLAAQAHLHARVTPSLSTLVAA